MKKIRISALFLLMLLVFSLTACGDNTNSGTSTESCASAGTSGNAGTSGSSGTTGSSGVSNSSNASPGPGSSTTNGTSGSVQESSKGVIDGLVDDVEQGVEDLTGETTSRASDESK